jgi:hypothetical protein
MKQEQVARFKRWFAEYTGRFYGDDEHVNAHIQLKQEHSERTCAEIAFLAGQLALDDDQRRIAEVIALFHDVGRFPQFARYRTFNDAASVDHCRLGVEILGHEGVLAALPREERQWVATAVEHHGRKTLPAHLRGQALLFSKLIRDADKLDIYRVVIDKYEGYRRDFGRSSLGIDLPDEPRYSPDVLEAILNERLVDSGKLRTLNDMRLCQIGWVYDMNFAAALERLRQRGHLEALFGFLPQTQEIARAREKVLQYLDGGLGRAAQQPHVSELRAGRSGASAPAPRLRRESSQQA